MISIVLQAGGKSSRMGRDKAMFPFLGIPLIFRLRDRFQEIAAELFVVSNNSTGYEELGLPLYQDLIPDRGALGGLYTALAVSSQPLVGIIAADMPFASPLLMSYQIINIQESDYDAVIPSTSLGIEPFHAVYRKESCLPLVKGALDQNLWKMISWHDQARIKILDPGETRQITGSDHTFLNLNTPDEFQAAEEIARNMLGFY
jgi:molybdopterin-guanine dinucleotide biosynthesis protein A